MTIKLNTSIRNVIVDYLLTIVGSGASGELKIYTGSAPVDANAVASGTLLVTIVLTSGHAASSAGAAALNMNETGVAVATGTAGWARWHDSSDIYRLDMSVGTTGTDAIITNATITNGGTVTLTALTLSQPAT